MSIHRLDPGALPTAKRAGEAILAATTDTYSFTLNRFRIVTTRAVHNDTDTVAFSLKIGDQPTVTKIKHLGDVNDGDHSVGLTIGPVAIRGTPRITLATTIINSGHKDQATLDRALSDAANAVIDAALDEIPGGELLELLTHWLVGLFVVDCDGVVVGERWRWPAHQLHDFTDRHNPWEIIHTYHGADSPVGCGANSEYTVTWHIARHGP